MKTLVNKNIPAIRITAPEVEKVYDKYYYIIGIRLGLLQENWTLVEEEPSIVKTIKEFVEKGKRCEQQAVEDNDQENYVFWGGFRNCAENILREIEEPTEGIKGNSEEIPSNVDLEKEIDEWLKAGPITDNRYDDYCDDDIQATARHFYELGLNARKE